METPLEAIVQTEHPKAWPGTHYRGGGSRAEQLWLGSLETTGFGQHIYITSALHPLTAGVFES